MTIMLYENEVRVKRERFRSMSHSSTYYWSWILIQFPIWIGWMSVGYILNYYISGLRYTPFTAFLIYMGFLWMTTIQAVAIGLVIASLTPNLRVALTVGTFYTIVNGLFNGSSVNTENITWILRWVRYISPQFYLNLGLNQNEFSGQELNGEPGEYWLNLYALNVVSELWCAGALVIVTVVSLLAGTFAFERKHRPN